jgi:hypothetical protein
MGSGVSSWMTKENVRVEPIKSKIDRSEESILSARRSRFVEDFMESLFSSQNQAYDSDALWNIIVVQESR